MVIQWVCNSKSLGCSPPPFHLYYKWLMHKKLVLPCFKNKNVPCSNALGLLFYFSFLHYWLMCEETLWALNTSVFTQFFLWQPEPQPVVLTCLVVNSSGGQGRALAGFSWGWEQSPLGSRLPAPLDRVSQTNVSVSISACNSHVMFFHRNFFPLFDSCQKDLKAKPEEFEKVWG